MILIIGAEASGKRAYAESLGYTALDMSEALDDKPVLYNLQNLVLRDVEGAPLLFDALLQKELVLCNEVGSGVIPVDANERLGREATGRLCIRLAQRAERVVRMVCGVPTVLKG